MFRVSAQGFADGTSIPDRFTCEGKDLPPAIRWQGEPPETKSFALIMDDPDAPGGTWNHWLVWDVPANVHSLPEGGGRTPHGISGTNDFGKRGYGGPCPPMGRGPHHYYFRLFAVNVGSLGLPEGTTRPALEEALRKHVIAQAVYTGIFERS